MIEILQNFVYWNKTNDLKSYAKLTGEKNKFQYLYIRQAVVAHSF